MLGSTQTPANFDSAATSYNDLDCVVVKLPISSILRKARRKWVVFALDNANGLEIMIAAVTKKRKDLR